ncbi:hypothetical protein EXS62_00370 [Candidatus Kaiserbacteria bacterium]|nr:hypothetical protein [Candidatus Kaiserbacteria bacterium]
MKNLIKFITGGALVALMLPTLALANENGSNAVKVRADLQTRIEKQFNRIEKGDKHDVKKDEKKFDRATTTAANITKQAVRIQGAVDVLASFDARLQTNIASSSNAAALTLKYNDYKTAATGAKTKAGTAISGAAQVNATNSTTTNAALLATAKVDLKESKGFFHDAQKLFMQILHSLWN